MFLVFFVDCMDKESEEFCAEVDCGKKKMAKKCMNTCELCEEENNDDDEYGE